MTPSHRLIAVAVLLSVALCPTHAGSSDDAQLEDLLERLAVNAAQYRDRALGFTCRETMTWVGNGDAGRARFGYVYIYDEATGFEEYRTRDRKNPRKKPPKRIEPESLGVPAYLNNAYLWCFTFKAERQQRHEYTILGTETIDGVEAVRIRFVPIPPLIVRVNDWYGTAWVDPVTAQPIKIEVFTPADWVKREAVREARRLTDHFSLQRITTHFDAILEGRRMPGKVELREEFYVLEEIGDDIIPSWGYRQSIFREVDQVYSDYRLFGVSSREEIGSQVDSR